MMLFRPHRDVHDIVRLSTRDSPNIATEDGIWIAVDTEYRRWRVEDVQERGKLYRSGADQDARVGSSGWWACLIHEKLRNYEAAMRRHHGESLTVPDDIGKLPVYPDNHRPTENTTARSGDESDKSSCMSVDMPEVPYAPEGEKQGRRANTGVPDPLATSCGVLPPVCFLELSWSLPPSSQLATPRHRIGRALLRSMRRTSDSEEAVSAFTQRVPLGILVPTMQSLLLVHCPRTSRASTECKLTSKMVASRAHTG